MFCTPTGNTYRALIGNIVLGKNSPESILLSFIFIWHIILYEQGILVISLIIDG